ncbi:MAG: ribonuclease R [Syntrophomonadaceae bacterium]|nr:ribonuclease R [Syntrophomonadaceae bacterium]
MKLKKTASRRDQQQITGRLQGHARGFGFVITEDESKDIYIAPEDIRGAMHNDQVVVRLKEWWKKQDRPEGEVVEIVERANRRIVGTFQQVNRMNTVTPDDQRLGLSVLIPPEMANGARSGDKVVVEITSWPQARRAPEGRVIEVLGAKGAPGVDVLSVIRKFELPEDFPKKVRREVRMVPLEVPAEAIGQRYDLRHLPIITIDGEDAKDLDDAVSVERLPDGNFLLGVHIADVAHYVREATALDAEARRRGTSVYLVDRVIPMLPPELSNGICSLHPRVDRLTKSVFMEFNPEGTLLNYALVNSVIRTTERMTYKTVRQILELLAARDSPAEPEAPRDFNPSELKRYEYLFEDLCLMQELASVLRRRRFKRGSLDFDLPECKVGLDEQGRPIELYRYPRSVADIIIEEFMLAANETVARHLVSQGLPGVFRVHEQPDSSKIEELEKSLAALGFSLNRSDKVTPRMIQVLLERVKGKPEERMVNTLVLRSMMRARYAPTSLGHFGLATKYYLHFTSPIRRYPDLVVHRVLDEVLPPSGFFQPRSWRPNTRAGVLREPQSGGGSRSSASRPPAADSNAPPERDKFLARIRELIPQIAEHSSERERNADEAERESVEMKMVEYMVQHLGEVFPGIISGVTPFGVFVQLENLVEGLVRVSSITDDYYQYVEAPPSLIGERSQRRLRIGDPVTVQVARVGVEERMIDFILVADPGQVHHKGVLELQ